MGPFKLFWKALKLDIKTAAHQSDGDGIIPYANEDGERLYDRMRIYSGERPGDVDTDREVTFGDATTPEYLTKMLLRYTARVYEETR